MLHTLEPTETPWRQGALRTRPGRLMFGQTYEDPEIELRAIPNGSRVFCIASAGTTAGALAAAGHHVTAVDISLGQIDYAQARIAGGLPRDGMAERLLEFGRNLAVLCGWTRRKLDFFLDLSCCREQVEFWDRELNTPVWRAMFDTLLAPRLLRLIYRSPFAASLPADFGPRVRERLRRGWARHGNRTNPFAALLLEGKPIANAHGTGLPIRFACADAADFLARCAPCSFDAFALSNIGDGASAEYRRRLDAAIKHAATTTAVVISRTFAQPSPGIEMNLAAEDRSLIWGAVSICRVGGVDEGGVACCIC